MHGVACPPRARRPFLGAIAAALAACSFPDVTFSPDADTMASGSSSGLSGDTGSGAAPDATQPASGNSASGSAAMGSTGAAGGSGMGSTGPTGTAVGSGSGSAGGSMGSTGAGSDVAATDSAPAEDTTSATDQTSPPEASGCGNTCKDATTPPDSTSSMDAISPMDSTAPHDTATADDKTAVDEGVVEAAMDVAATCDADLDQWSAQGPLCGGLDCDDNDARANPGVTQFQTYAPTPKTQGDWNCDGHVDKEHKTNISCGLLDLGSCNTTFGFTGDPACGSTGQYVQCQSNGLLCGQGTLSNKVQGCL